jgi:hypothetical protein
MAFGAEETRPSPRKSHFLVRLFVAALLIGLICIALLNLVDPKHLGITTESNRIVYIGGLGLLAGFAGLVAVLSLFTLALQKVTARLGPGTRIAAAFAVLLSLMLLAMLAFRFVPR